VDLQRESHTHERLPSAAFVTFGGLVHIDLSQPAAQFPFILPGAVIPAKQPFSFARVESSERQQKGLKCAF
jgi:hypothetical protein